SLSAAAAWVSCVASFIRWSSNLFVSSMFVLLRFVLVTGPTLFLLRGLIQSLGLYLQNLFRLSFTVGAEQGSAGLEWSATWSTFYWGWWMSWAPFVGIFIARISAGRTVRQFIAGTRLVPVFPPFV